MTDIPAGTYLVLDPAVRTSIGDLLRTAGSLLDTALPTTAAPAAPAPAGQEPAAAELDAARTRIVHLDNEATQTQRLLSAVTAELERERSAHAATREALDRIADLGEKSATSDDAVRAARDELDRVRTDLLAQLEHAREEQAQSAVRLTETQVDLEHTRAELTAAVTELDAAKKAAATTAAPKPLHGNSARAKDRKAWVALSEWIEREASTQSTEASKVMRIVRREVDREIAKLYGETGKAAS